MLRWTQYNTLSNKILVTRFVLKTIWYSCNKIEIHSRRGIFSVLEINWILSWMFLAFIRRSKQLFIIMKYHVKSSIYSTFIVWLNFFQIFCTDLWVINSISLSMIVHYHPALSHARLTLYMAHKHVRLSSCWLIIGKDKNPFYRFTQFRWKHIIETVNNFDHIWLSTNILMRIPVARDDSAFRL